MSEVVVTGNLAGDPELRYTADGRPVAGFTVCQTDRYFDRATGEWADRETIFMRCSLWGDAAENIAASLHRGDRVVCVGRLKSRTFEVEGVKRTVLELDADDVGPSIKWATVKVNRADRSGAPSSDDAWAPASSALKAAG